MKKKLGLAIGGIVAASILGLGIFHSSASQTDASMTGSEIEQMVAEQYPGEITDVQQETEFKRAVYEVKIRGDEKEYSLKLDGDNGDILNITEKPVKHKPAKKQEDKQQADKKQADKTDKQDKQADTNKEDKKTVEQNDPEPKKTVISAQEAGEIALNEFSGEIDEIELEEEDGRLIYEVEIERGEQEAEIEIDAYTGEIIVIEMD